MNYYSSRKDPYKLQGYRNWYQPFNYYDTKQNYRAFIVDFETFIFSEEVSDTSEEENLYQNEEHREKKSKFQSVSCIIVYFIADGERRRALLRFTPYFYLVPKNPQDKTALNFLRSTIKNLDKRIIDAKIIMGYDCQDLVFLKEKAFIQVLVQTPSDVPALRDTCEKITGVKEWREADIQFHHRVAIDTGLRVGKWFNLTINGGEIRHLEELDDASTPELNIIAYDIEVENPKIRDPSVEKDEITMISLFNGTKNVVIVNANKVNTEKVEDITVLVRNVPDKKLPIIDWCPASNKTAVEDKSVINRAFCQVQVVNDEKDLLLRFLRYIEDAKPDVIADFYGDKFDLPYLIGRSKRYNIEFEKRTGFKLIWKLGTKKPLDQRDLLKDVESVENVGAMHLDAYLWNAKYSYLPKKDLGLKPSVKARLKIIPIDREALWAIKENPTEAIAYSASDGYITWRYVKEIIMDFVLSMGQMFPVPSCELLTKTAGALDDLLVDGIGHKKRIVAKKRITPYTPEVFSPHIIIQSWSYTGGMVGALNPGIWRSDIEYSMPINIERSEYIAKKVPKVYKKAAEGLLNNTKKESFEKQVRELFGDQNDAYYEYIKNSTVKNYRTEIFNHLKSTKNEKEATKKVSQIIEEIDQYTIVNPEKNIDRISAQIKEATDESQKTKVRPVGIHIDVTSMYPSQIRQYKIQPSGLVSPADHCQTCPHRESNGSCWIEQGWTAKLVARRPCINRRGEKCAISRKDCDYTLGSEEQCNNYDTGTLKDIKAQEFWSYDGEKERVYKYERKRTEEITITESFLGREMESFGRELYDYLGQWVANNIEGTRLTNEGLGNVGVALAAPANSYLYVEAKSKNLSFLVSVKSRLCQKAYSHVHAVMDDFFQRRVWHKNEAKRVDRLIKLKKEKGEPVSETLISKQKFHNSTQLGLKVPLNSIYGLLGMKAGVHNASMPCAGITTAFSANLIKWGVDYISGIGKVTEFDSLDYETRLILKNPKGLFEILPIGQFVEKCLQQFGAETIDSSRNVEYTDVYHGWHALSVNSTGNVEWQPIKKAIRQKTERNVIQLTTPFGSVKTTESHSVFCSTPEKIQPIEVKNLKDEHITHICKIPLIESPISIINLLEGPSQLELFAYIRVAKENAKWSQYPQVRLRIHGTDKYQKYYQIPHCEYTDTPNDITLGTYKSNKYVPTISLTEELAELCGWYVSEGTSGIYNGVVSVGITHQKRETLDRIKLLADFIGHQYVSDFQTSAALSDKQSNTDRISLDNVFFFRLFEALGCGNNAFEKRIPNIILSAKKSIKEAFLCGYLEADGSYQGKMITFQTVSDGLRDDLFVLGKQLNYMVSIQLGQSSTSGSLVYIIHFMQRENWEIGSRNQYSHVKVGETVGLQVKTTSEVVKSNPYVYDLAVETNNNFVAANGGILCHNTDGIWAFVPEKYPAEFAVEINDAKNGLVAKRNVNLLEEIINEEIEDKKANLNYWTSSPDGKFVRERKCLLKFEQDGPYDFQFVMGKKKYIVYNHQKDGKWAEKEITGLETKRSDFSELHKTLQMEILNAFLVDYQQPGLTIEKLYQSALDTVQIFIQKIREGKFAVDVFVQPKAVTKALEEYNTMLPQVAGAYVLRDLGFNVEKGQRIDLIRVKSSGKKKSDAVLPKQLFDFPIETIKEIIAKRGIGTLSLMTKRITTKEELLKELLDVNSYIDDIIGKDRIIKRMIIEPMKKQRINVRIPSSLSNDQKEESKTKNLLTMTSRKEEKKPVSLNKVKKTHDDVLPHIVPKSEPYAVSKAGKQLDELPHEKNPQVDEGKMPKEPIITQNAPPLKTQSLSTKTQTAVSKEYIAPSRAAALNKDRNQNLFAFWDNVMHNRGNSTKTRSLDAPNPLNGLFNEIKNSFSLKELLMLTDGQSIEVYYCHNCNLYYEVFTCSDGACPNCSENVEYIYDLLEHSERLRKSSVV